MQQAGEVVFSAVDGSKKHEGVVEYAKSEFVRWAMDKLDGTEINGRKISLVDETKDKKRSEKRSRSKTESKSRSKSRSRSRSR
jgi:arginine/serine-rich splicing factor 4/5/6